MTFNLILLIILFLSLTGIIFVLRKKLILLANLDVSQIKENQVAEIKKDLLRRKVERKIVIAKNATKIKIIPIFKSIFRSILIVYKIGQILGKRVLLFKIKKPKKEIVQEEISQNIEEEKQESNFPS